MSTHFSFFVSSVDSFPSVSCCFILGCVHYHSHPHAVQSQRQYKGNGRGPSFNFLLLPSWNSIILIQPAVRTVAAHLEPLGSSLPFVSVSLAGAWCLRSQSHQTVSHHWALWCLEWSVIWSAWDDAVTNTKERWKCMKRFFIARALMVKFSCKWAHYLDIP